MYAEILPEIKTKLHKRIGDGRKIGIFIVRAVQKYQQIPVGVCSVVASCTRPVQQQMTTFGKQFLTKSLYLRQYFFLAQHTFIHLCDCKGTTNIWNIQGFCDKNQIYLNFFVQNRCYSHNCATVPSENSLFIRACRRYNKYLEYTRFF